jgi:hypothetical protein
MLDALSRICDEKELGLHWPQTDLQRSQRQANLPPSYLPTDGNGNAPIATLSATEQKWPAASAAKGQTPRKRHLGQARMEMRPRIVLRFTTR